MSLPLVHLNRLHPCPEDINLMNEVDQASRLIRLLLPLGTNFNNCFTLNQKFVETDLYRVTENSILIKLVSIESNS